MECKENWRVIVMRKTRKRPVICWEGNNNLLCSEAALLIP